jgi:hypothetical protein
LRRKQHFTRCPDKKLLQLLDNCVEKGGHFKTKVSGFLLLPMGYGFGAFGLGLTSDCISGGSGPLLGLSDAGYLANFQFVKHTNRPRNSHNGKDRSDKR